jgi:hypothetical protein
MLKKKQDKTILGLNLILISLHELEIDTNTETSASL